MVLFRSSNSGSTQQVLVNLRFVSFFDWSGGSIQKVSGKIKNRHIRKVNFEVLTSAKMYFLRGWDKLKNMFFEDSTYQIKDNCWG